jgi:hypothetical protein
MKTLGLLALIVLSAPAFADPAVIQSVSPVKTDDTWRFDVTISHPDTGWDHYTDGWRVLSMDGTELGMRALHHPHVDEQPFTRSLSGVLIPPGTKQVQIQTRCLVDGWNPKMTTVKLP